VEGLRPRAGKGKAPRTVPAGAVSPVFRAKVKIARRHQCQARADARIPRAPSGGWSPSAPRRPCPCYPGLADGQGCSAALRFNPAWWRRM